MLEGGGGEGGGEGVGYGRDTLIARVPAWDRCRAQRLCVNVLRRWSWLSFREDEKSSTALVWYVSTSSGNIRIVYTDISMTKRYLHFRTDTYKLFCRRSHVKKNARGLRFD